MKPNLKPKAVCGYCGELSCDDHASLAAPAFHSLVGGLASLACRYIGRRVRRTSEGDLVNVIVALLLFALLFSAAMLYNSVPV